MNETNQPNALILDDSLEATNAPIELRDIKPPVEIPGDWTWLWWVLLVVVVVVTAFYLWRWYRNRDRSKAEAIATIPPHIRAREALTQAMLLIHDPKQFCTAVSLAVRVYLEERFSLQAPDRTTEEFLIELKNSVTLNIEHKQALGEFLETCDLVKFAKFEPAQSDLEAMHTLAHRIIDETEPFAPGSQAEVATSLDSRRPSESKPVEYHSTPTQMEK
jgi:hypothetical protein